MIGPWWTTAPPKSYRMARWGSNSPKRPATRLLRARESAPTSTATHHILIASGMSSVWKKATRMIESRTWRLRSSSLSRATRRGPAANIVQYAASRLSLISEPPASADQEDRVVARRGDREGHQQLSREKSSRPMRSWKPRKATTTRVADRLSTIIDQYEQHGDDLIVEDQQT